MLIAGQHAVVIFFFADEAPAEEAEPPTAWDKLLFMVFATEFAVSETTLETVFFKRLSKKPI